MGRVMMNDDDDDMDTYYNTCAYNFKPQTQKEYKIYGSSHIG
jgi:hypothetical protein